MRTSWSRASVGVQVTAGLLRERNTIATVNVGFMSLTDQPKLTNVLAEPQYSLCK